MSFLDDAMGSLGGQLGGFDIAGLAAHIGLDPDQVKEALAALAAASAKPGDTATDAAAETGLPLEKIEALLAHIGGEGALTKVTGMLGGLGGLFGKA